MRVDLIISKDKSLIDLFTFKDKILKKIKNDKDFWNADVNLLNTNKLIENADSIKHIIEMMTNKFYQ